MNSPKSCYDFNGICWLVFLLRISRQCANNKQMKSQRETTKKSMLRLKTNIFEDVEGAFCIRKCWLLVLIPNGMEWYITLWKMLMHFSSIQAIQNEFHKFLLEIIKIMLSNESMKKLQKLFSFSSDDQMIKSISFTLLIRYMWKLFKHFSFPLQK